MWDWGGFHYGWTMIALEVALLFIAGTIIMVPVEHGREVRYATPVDCQAGDRPGCPT